MEKVKLTNKQLFDLQRSRGLNRIADSIELDIETSDKVYKLIQNLTRSSEALGLRDSIGKFAKANGVVDSDGGASFNPRHPDFIILMECDSGLEVDMITISRKNVNVSVNDRLETECVIDYH